MLKTELLKKFETYILAEGLRPGDRLPGELELAAYFGISRGTLREVIGYLVLKGILERRTSQGTLLRLPEVNDVADDLAFQMKLMNCGREELKYARETLEQSIAPGLVRYATPTHLDRLTEINRNMMATGSDMAAADRFDLAFHMALFDITGNRLLKIFAQILTVQFEEKLRPPFSDPAAVMVSGAVHEEMIEAIVQKNAVELIRLMREHIKPLPS